MKLSRKAKGRVNLALSICFAVGMAMIGGLAASICAVLWVVGACVVGESRYIDGRLDQLDEVIDEEKRRAGEALELERLIREVAHEAARRRTVLVRSPKGPSN